MSTGSDNSFESIRALIRSDPALLEPGLRLLDFAFRISGRTRLDAIGLDRSGGLVLVAVATGDPEASLARLLDGHLWAADQRDLLGRLYSSAGIRVDRPARGFLLAPSFTLELLRRLSLLSVEIAPYLAREVADRDGARRALIEPAAPLFGLAPEGPEAEDEGAIAAPPPAAAVTQDHATAASAAPAPRRAATSRAGAAGASSAPAPGRAAASRPASEASASTSRPEAEDRRPFWPEGVLPDDMWQRGSLPVIAEADGPADGPPESRTAQPDPLGEADMPWPDTPEERFPWDPDPLMPAESAGSEGGEAAGADDALADAAGMLPAEPAPPGTFETLSIDELEEFERFERQRRERGRRSS